MADPDRNSETGRRRIYFASSLLLLIGLTILKMDTWDVQSTVQHFGDSFNNSLLRGGGDVVRKAANSNLINVAKGKTATQSSTFKNREASYVIDGDIGTFSHTGDIDKQPWLEIDLGDSYLVHSIIILNRWCKDPNDSAECLCRLSGAKLSLIDDTGSEVTTRDIGVTCDLKQLVARFDQDCSSFNLPLTASGCLPAAQRIKIQSRTSNPIQLFEVMVYSPGKDESPFSESDDIALGETGGETLAQSEEQQDTEDEEEDAAKLPDVGETESETLAQSEEQQDKENEDAAKSPDDIALGEALSEMTMLTEAKTFGNPESPPVTPKEAPVERLEVISEVSSEEQVDSAEPQEKPAQDEKCQRMFEWSMIDQWHSDGKDFDLNNLPQTKTLTISRMGGPSATGTLKMSINVRNAQLDLTVVDLTHMSNDLRSRNVWHRHTVLYGTWVGVQIATRRYELLTRRTVYVHDCNGDLPMEWQNLGEISCDRNLMNQADVLITPPNDGLMWDLAWDFNFECRDSEMYKAYAALFVDKTSKLEPTEAKGCWISRRGANQRSVANLDAVFDMMREVFPVVEEIVFTADKTGSETADMIKECRVLFGIHGAGHTNAIYARPGVGVVEVIGNYHPAYYRNINLLLNQYYQSIVGDRTKKMDDNNYNIDLEEARAALIKARDHAEAWIQEHGHWRRALL